MSDKGLEFADSSSLELEFDCDATHNIRSVGAITYYNNEKIFSYQIKIKSRDLFTLIYAAIISV